MMDQVVFIAGIIGTAASAYWLGYCQGKRKLARKLLTMTEKKQ